MAELCTGVGTKAIGPHVFAPGDKGIVPKAFHRHSLRHLGMLGYTHLHGLPVFAQLESDSLKDSPQQDGRDGDGRGRGACSTHGHTFGEQLVRCLTFR